MTDLVKAIAEFIKFGPRYFFVIALVTGVLIFSGQEFLEQIGVLQLAEDYRPWIGIGFLVSAALCFASVADSVYKFIRSRILQRNFNRKIEKFLHQMTENEKQILRFYIAEQTKTNVLRFDDGVVQGLVAKGVIFLSSPMGNPSEGFAYNINEFAWEFLNKNEHVLDGSTDICRTDKRISPFYFNR